MRQFSKQVESTKDIEQKGPPDSVTDTLLRGHLRLNKSESGGAFSCVLLWIAGLAVILYFCLINHWPTVEKKLSGNVSEAVQAVGVSNPEITLDGRNVLLQGVVENQSIKEAATDAAREVAGIRAVDNRQTIKPMVVPEVKLENSSFGLTSSGNQITLSGQLPTIDLSESLEAETKKSFATKTIVNEITIDANTAKPVWIDNTLQGISALQLADNPVLTIKDNDLTISGDVSSADSAEKIAQTFAPLLDNKLSFSNNLVIAEPVVPIDPELSIKQEGDNLLLTGTLQTAQQSSRIEKALQESFSSATITNQLTIEAAASDADWLDSTVDLIPSLSSISELDVAITTAGAVISGKSDNEESSSAQKQEIQKTLGKLLPVETSLSLQPAPIPEPEPEPIPEPIPEPEPEPEPTPEVSSGPATDSATIPDAPASLREAMEAFDTSAIRFESGSAVLTAESRRVLDDIASILANFPARGINITGHTDSRGSEIKNLELSQMRAESVKEYLTSVGIPETRLEAYGFGDSAPIGDNETATGRARNRRIEFNY